MAKQDAAQQAFEAGRQHVLSSWKSWYEQMPADLKAQVDAYNTARRALATIEDAA